MTKEWLLSASPEGLSAEQRERSRAFLSEYMAMRPIAEGSTATPWFVRIRAMIPIPRNRFSPIAALMVFLVFMTSTTYAAEGALPGNPLYAMKVKVNEELRGALTFSPEARTDWSINRTERRLQEAASLALVGELNEKTRAQLEANIESHVHLVEENSSLLSVGNTLASAAIEARLQAVLDANIGVLDAIQISIGEGESYEELASILARVEKYAAVPPMPDSAASTMALSASARAEEATTDSGKEISSREVTEARTVAKKRLDAAQHMAERAQRASNSFGSDSSVWAGADTRLTIAIEAYRSGEEAEGKKEYAAAVQYFDAAMRAAIESEALFNARSHIFEILKKRSSSKDDQRVNETPSTTNSGSVQASSSTSSTTGIKDTPKASSAVQPLPLAPELQVKLESSIQAPLPSNEDTPRDTLIKVLGEFRF